jgi:hypothetical protein
MKCKTFDLSLSFLPFDLSLSFLPCSVSLSFQQPVETQEKVYVATLNLLEGTGSPRKGSGFVMPVPANVSGT